jgi:death-on-curing protein
LPKNKATVFRLSAAFIEHLHDEVVSAIWPQGDPVSSGEFRDRRLIESAASRPFQSAFGQDAYPELLEKGTALFHSLIANHCFHNGNKRTAVIALDWFLLANGAVLAWDSEETYELARLVASYRERGRSRAEVFDEVLEALTLNVAPLSALKEYPSLRALHRALLNDRRYVRGHILNKQRI